jgi:serine/threonine-protein kinase
MLYLVMEFLRGRDLARIMHEESPLPIPRVLDLAQGVLGALGEAHARGVVHRDLKPENIIIESLRGGGDLVKVVDFGLAKIRDVEPAEAARGLVAGTPDYMAPEQARALEVDGRSDLYSLGVVLFELLTGRLPFIDDTPSKVMTKHVFERVPNPQEVAPYRGIPDALVELVLKALAKDPKDRFQDADEMLRSVRAISAQLRTSTSGVRCPSCGALTEAQRAFCGDCGRRLTAPTAQVRTGPPAGERPLVGRSAVLAQLLELLQDDTPESRIIYLLGELGIGKTRLLDELRLGAAREGFVVVESGPHESGAPVAYGALRRAVARLLNVAESKLSGLAEDESLWRDPLARAGMQELINPEGLPGHEGRSRVAAVAAALARAVELAAGRASRREVLLCFDDLPRCDSLSAEVLAAFAEHGRQLPVRVVVASHAPLALTMRWRGTAVELTGIADGLAREFVRAEFTPPQAALGGALPLHLEQLRALRWEPSIDEPSPPSLADAVMRRLALLDVETRRVLQALAVVGERVDTAAVQHMVDAEDMHVLVPLVDSEFLRVLPTGDYAFAHPFLRDVVEASIPAETRKTLHARALDLASHTGKPLEVRAQHAFRAGEVMTALMLLERMGQESLRRGDPGVGMLAFHHGLELARREMLETGDEALDSAIVSFSRQLAEAMVWAGDVTGAAGVLNEAFQLAGPLSLERARMTLVLGRVAERRDRPREAARQLLLASELAHKLGNRVLEARAQWALSRVRKAEGDSLGAVNALTTAVDRLTEAEPRSARRCLCELELGEVLIDLGDTEAATEHLERALDLARDGDWSALSAAAYGVLASIDELAGERERARQRYKEAAQLAAKAGDASGRERWRRAVQALSG